MCGIVGLHGPQDDAWIEAMNSAQCHRGPDDAGLYRDRDASLSLAMSRLAILDLAGGRQPMRSDDGRYVLVFNGEIFNAPDLRRDLEAQGVRFTTDHSDTEVLLHMLMREGEAALQKLNGMFVFAFYDRDKHTLLLARDRLGIKPLYFTQQAGRLAFASEMKSLLALPFVDRAIERQGLFHYLSLMYVPGDRSIIAGVRRVPAGHLARYRLDDGALVVAPWWSFEYAPDRSVSEREWPERIGAALDRSVARWSLSDVPLSVSLSGGLDSSGIVALARRRGLDVRTVSLGFTGDNEDQWNELPLARTVAEKWGTPHREVVMAPDDLLAELPRMVWHLDEPYGGGLPSWAVFKEMAREVKVGLTGVGGDEMFGNYGRWRTLEGGVLRRALGLAIDVDDFRDRYVNRWHYFPDAEKRAALADGGAGVEDTTTYLWDRYRATGAEAVRDGAAQLEIGTQLPDEFLLMTDRFSMAHSLEARTPFLDNEMVDLVRTIPAKHRTQRGDLKGLLRRALEPVLPAEIVNAPKRGFVIPLELWLRGPLRKLVERLLDPRRLSAQGIFRPNLLEHHFNPHLLGDRDLTTRAWGLLMFQLWHLLVIERPHAAGAPGTLADVLDAT